LYGLYQARRAIRDAGRVLVVEGYMDVVALAQAEVEYAVATLGTATTPVHVQKLLRQVDEIVFCFDGDDAGRRAAWRALENSLALLTDGKQVKFLFLPEGEDPDTYVRKHGKSEFETLLLKGAVPLSKFLLDELAGRVDLGAAEGRARLVHEAKPLLKQMQPNVLRAQLLRELAEKSRLSPEEVTQLCELGGAAARARLPEAPRVPRKPVTSLAEQLLQTLVSHPSCVEKVTEEQRSLLDAPEFSAVAELIDALKGWGATTSAMVVEATRESPHGGLYQDIAAQTLNEVGDSETAARVLADVLLKLERQRMEVEFARLSSGGQRSDVERQRFQEVKQRLAELQKATTGRRAEI
jgi:DNA primase